MRLNIKVRKLSLSTRKLLPDLEHVEITKMSKKKRKSAPDSASVGRHYKLGSHSGKGPRLRHAMKREAEATSVRSKSQIRDPKSSIQGLFHPKVR